MAIGRVPGETGIQPSIVTAKGDLIVATANGSVTNQAVGSNNQVLMADSAQADGVKWANEATSTLTTTGDMLYASAANTLARRAIGSTGDVLTVSGGLPTWAAPSAGANWSLLNTGGTALTGATTVTVSGISAKDKLMLVVDGASAAASAVISIRFNGDTGNNYTFGAQPSFSTLGSAGSVVASYDRIVLGDLSSNAASVMRGWIQFSGCNASGLKIGNFSACGTAAGGSGQTGSSSFAMYSGTSTISSVSVVSSSGNLDAGTFYVYTSA